MTRLHVGRITRWLIVAVAFGLAGCGASGPKISEIAPQVPPLAADQGRIWFYLLNETQGCAVRTADGVVLCRLSERADQKNVAAFVDLPPGVYMINNGFPINRRETKVTVVAGQTKYVQLLWAWVGLAGTVEFRIIPADIAWADISNCRYAGEMSALKGQAPAMEGQKQ